MHTNLMVHADVLMYPSTIKDEDKGAVVLSSQAIAPLSLSEPSIKDKPMIRITSVGTSPNKHGCKRPIASLALTCHLKPVSCHLNAKYYRVTNGSVIDESKKSMDAAKNPSSHPLPNYVTAWAIGLNTKVAT